MPDFIVRYGIRILLKRRLTALVHANQAINKKNKDIFIQAMDEGPIALVPELANKQHYEIPSTFYDLCLGKNKKYSSCFWNKATGNLDSAEDLALKLTWHGDLGIGKAGCGLLLHPLSASLILGPQNCAINCTMRPTAASGYGEAGC